jgi:tetratricopeptide (TPR) repeat protein
MRPFLTILATLAIQFLSAQTPQEFLERLRDNSDQQVLTRFAVDHDLGKLDSAQFVQTVDKIEKEIPRSSPVIKTRLAALRARISFYKFGPGDSLYAEQMKAALYKAHEEEEAFMIAEYSRWYSEMLNSIGKKNEAVQYALNSMVLQEQLGFQFFPDVKTFYLTVGELFFRTRNPREAAKWLEKGLERQDKDSVIPVNEANAINNLALCYRQLKEYRKTLANHERCMAFSKQHGLEDWYMLSYYNRLPTWIDLGEYDSCMAILPTLYKNSQEQNNEYSAAGACFHLGQVAMRKKEFSNALTWLKKSEVLADKLGIRAYRINICKELSICYDSLHQFDKSLIYYKEYRYLDDSVARTDASQRSDYLMAKANFEKQQIDFHKLKNKRDSDIQLRNVGIIVLVVLSGLVIWWLNRKRRKAKRSQREAETQLKLFTDNIVNKDQQIEALQTELQQQSDNEEKASRVEELAQQMILTEDDWQRFQFLFNKTYPGFLLRLKEKATGITEAELRMATLLKIQLGTRQIAAMQGISTDTVHKTRQRLRQRFGTSSTSELEAMIATV